MTFQDFLAMKWLRQYNHPIVFLADEYAQIAHKAEGYPVVVCLCGSTRFYEEFQKANFRETISGKVVLTIGCNFKSEDALGLPPETKEQLDQLHKRKIDLSDEILVLDVGGYIGNSTRSEIEYAIAHGKRVRYLSHENA